MKAEGRIVLPSISWKKALKRILQSTRVWLTAAALMLSAFENAASQAKDDNQGITREQGDAILDELRRIHALLDQLLKNSPSPMRPSAPPRVSLSLGSHFTLGSSTAPVTLVEFTDYQCPYCKRFHDDTFPALKKELVETGKLRFVSRDLPLKMHPDAVRAAEAARCAGEQGQFWTIRDKMFANSGHLSLEKLVEYASTLPLDLGAFAKCLDEHRYLKAIQDDIEAAGSVGITGTPSFILGETTDNKVEGFRLVGAQATNAFLAQVKQLLPRP